MSTFHPCRSTIYWATWRWLWAEDASPRTKPTHRPIGRLRSAEAASPNELGSCNVRGRAAWSYAGRHSFEFATVVAIIGIVALWLLRALSATGEEIEEAALQSEVSAIRIELLDRLAHRETAGGDLPASNNPLAWIGHLPAAYLGEIDRAPAQNRVWYYDRSRDELVYRFRSSREARFRLFRTGAPDGGAPGTLSGVALRRVQNMTSAKK